jgi:ribosome-binding factor A
MVRSNFRLARVNAVIKEILSEIILNDVKDPRVGLVTVTGVDTSADLSAARVHYSVMGDQEQRDLTLKILRGASGYMRHHIAQELEIKFAPELRWVYDDSLDRAFRIDQVLSREDNNPPAAPATDDTPATDDAPAADDAGPEEDPAA